MKKFVEDPFRKVGASSEYLVVVSRHAYDIAGSDTDRDWTNCMSMKLSDTHPRVIKMKASSDEKERERVKRYSSEGENVRFLEHEVREGSLMAYLIKKDDKDIKNPVAVLNIKPYEKNGEIYIQACQNSYSLLPQNEDFKYTVREWLKEVNIKKRGKFFINPRVYRDSDATEILVNVLDMSNKSLKTLSSINNEKTIKETVCLNCNNNQLENLDELANFKNLEELNCSSNKLQNLSGIGKLDKLEIVDCSHNPTLKSIESIRSLENLQKLYCHDNGLESLDGVQDLEKLEVLHCYDNDLKTLKPLRNLSNLKELFCYGNGLESLEGIENLKGLKKLSCFNNKLSNLNEIKNMDNVKVFCPKNNWKTPLPKEIYDKVVTSAYTKEQRTKFKSYDFQKEYLEKHPNRVKDLEVSELGLDDKLREEMGL
ncbi:leucine-rich repeat domain-containing protein [bacterium]|nr:leucine-rich repeat domain-containing protein [bacterium]